MRCAGSVSWGGPISRASRHPKAWPPGLGGLGAIAALGLLSGWSGYALVVAVMAVLFHRLVPATGAYPHHWLEGWARAMGTGIPGDMAALQVRGRPERHGPPLLASGHPDQTGSAGTCA